MQEEMVNYKKMIRIAALNTNGVRGNLLYVNKLTEDNEIIFCSEHWLNKNESYLINNLNKKFNTIFFSPMEVVNKVGRPWGGLFWIIKKEIKILNYEVLEDGISYIEIVINNKNLVIIGSYLTSQSSKIDQKVKYDSQLLIIREKINLCRQENKKFILIGDLNGDILRNKYSNDLKLNHFIRNNKIKSLKNNTNNINFSYYKENCKSLIDHVIVDNDEQNITMEILKHDENTSDHLVIIAKINIDEKSIVIEKKKEPSSLTKNINWQNCKNVCRYEELVNQKLRDLRINNIIKENENYESKIDEYYMKLIDVFLTAHEELIKERYNNTKTGNNWWTKEMSILKKNLQIARNEFKINQNTENKELVKIAKKKFRKEQRRCVFVFEEKKNKNIENLFNKHSKEEFWKAVNNYKNNDSKKDIKEENVTILKNNIKDLFTQDEIDVNNDPDKGIIIDTVRNHEMQKKRELQNQEKEYVNNTEIKNIIKEMKNSSTRGYDGMCNNMIKSINSELVQQRIKTLINLILNTSYTPKILNRTIIVPIIKDKSRRQFDKNNFRPISVSNVIAQILEKVILMKCKVLQQT